MKRYVIKSYTVLLDNADYNKVKSLTWTPVEKGKHVYFINNYKTRKYLPQFILGKKKDKVIDHINQNTLDNRKKNLRHTTKRINAYNVAQPKANNTSGFNGVSWSKEKNKWVARMHIKGKYKFLGYFDGKGYAIKKIDEEDIKLFGKPRRVLRFAVSDIHGNYKALKQVLKKSKFNYDKDFLIIIGDVVDGYNCSFEVVEELLKIKNKVFCYGNHDIWFMSYIANGWAENIWLMQGGKETRESYKSHGYHYKKMLKTHRDFFNNGVYWYELDNMLFVHGGFDYPKHPKDCSIENLTWDRELIERMRNGLKIKEWKKIFVGHTTTENIDSKPFIINNYGDKFAKLIDVDCGAGWSGRLCLYDIDTDKYFLSDYAKELNKDGGRK